MPQSSRELPSHPAKRRTNSLGRAKSDCHTCLREHRQCDRQRPRCGTCLRLGTNCDGYVQNLCWMDGLAARKPFSPAVVQSVDLNGSAAERDPHRKTPRREFKFKVGRPKRKRMNWRVKAQEPVQSRDHLPRQQRSFDNAGPASDSKSAAAQPWVESNITLDSKFAAGDRKDSSGSGNSESSQNSTTTITTTTCSMTSVSPISSRSNSVYQTGYEPFSPTALNASTESLSSSPHSPTSWTPIPRGVMYAHLVDRYSNVLQRYNKEFCMLPLTMHFDDSLNPFQCPQVHSKSADFLFHAVLALASHHLSELDNDKVVAERALQHQASSLRQYRKAISSSKSPVIDLLDTLTILLSLDGAQSGLGTWKLHLNAAYKMIEQAGGPQFLLSSARLRTQTSMFIWWDATVALVARRKPIFPLSYLFTITKYCEKDGWSFFVLNGCPEELVVFMSSLARLAWEFSKVERPADVSHAVIDIEKALKQWQNPFATMYTSTNSQANWEEGRDKFHTVETWRQALLLYVYRIFKYNRGASSISTVFDQAKVVLENANCIRRESFLSKQVLLPVFLAGCECAGDALQAFAREYCDYWDHVCRYHLFRSAHDVLARVHNERAQSNDVDLWWGPIIDQLRREQSPTDIEMEFLFG